ncbi:leucine-rich repeat protein [Hoylesella oralis]|uniref:leucine-rich repeat protein n=1 Tax=Hoylesella oralis TaxID=28134 RepID=UPI0028ECA5D5|nr:leucine-rich repeat protein [Hoylesella oralis]
MKRIILLCFAMLSIGYAMATLETKVATDGSVTLTLKAAGDLANGFNGLQESVKNAKKIAVVTAAGVSMSSADMTALCGGYDGPKFPLMEKLDLENAEVSNDDDLKWVSVNTHLKSITFPKNTKKIPDMCLKYVGSGTVEEVIIPDNPDRSLTIGAQAFAISTLKRVVLGCVSSGTIELQAFLNCTALTKVDFHTGWTKIDNQAFLGCTALKDVVLPEGITEIGYGAFSGSAIETIHLSSTLKTIRATAFLCSNLKSITIPAGVELIEAQAFQNCYNLSDVYVLGANTKAQEQAFPPANTYNYNYNGAGAGEVVTKDAFTYNDGNMRTRTVLHYPKDAYDKYVNQNTKTLGTAGNTTRYVTDKDGNKWPVADGGKYNNNTGDYAGWNNFMLVSGLKKEETWEDDKRIDDKWYTLCLPFDMTETQLKSAYGSTVEVVEFSDVEVTTSADHDKMITLKFKTPVTSTRAHHPYMIHPGMHAGTATGVKTTITGIEKQEEKQESLENQKVVVTKDGVTYTFIGNYDKTKHLPAPSYYYYSGKDVSQFANAFYKWTAANSGTWTPYTACVVLDKDNGANAKPMVSFFSKEDNSPTGINSVSAGKGISDRQPADNKVYNMNGQVVCSGNVNLKNLPKGIYIVNGKKYIVR